MMTISQMLGQVALGMRGPASPPRDHDFFPSARPSLFTLGSWPSGPARPSQLGLKLTFLLQSSLTDLPLFFFPSNLAPHDTCFLFTALLPASLPREYNLLEP